MKIWSTLGPVSPRELVGTRVVVHYAAQALAATAYALLPTPDDHSHANLLWSPDRRRFHGRPLPGGNRAFLDVQRFVTGVLDPNGDELAVIDPRGTTLDELLAHMLEALRATGTAGENPALVVPDYDLPASALAEGGPFPTPDPAALRELASWFHDAFVALSEVSERRLDGAEVRCWPHHFDIAALLVLDPDRDPERARSIGVGLSPGDGTIAEPYFYVTPWPAPAPRELPPLPDGARWQTEGFTSAVLTGSEIVTRSDGPAQHERVRRVLESTVAASRALLDG